ncbi:MAG: aminotransferase class I/II-fold pyridoxal phosphate-dependent enzyme [Luteitalea sp.]|nr:aminotransferase class I/II-fold pyridoxal phosphate-dependent enzyme [Luteitalea sp.]
MAGLAMLVASPSRPEFRIDSSPKAINRRVCTSASATVTAPSSVAVAEVSTREPLEPFIFSKTSDSAVHWIRHRPAMVSWCPPPARRPCSGTRRRDDMSRQAPHALATEVGRGLSRRAVTRSLAAATLGASLWPRTAFGTARAISSAPGEDGGPLRLSSNENSYGLGPAALEALRASLSEANRYPSKHTSALGAALAALHEVGEEQVALAPGSGEILRATTLAFTSSSHGLVTAAPTFEAPSRTAALIGTPIDAVPVQPSGALDLTAMAARGQGAGLFFVCNPNNPTGGVNSSDAITDFVARVRRTTPDAVILVDEAYYEYVEDRSYATALPLTRTDPRIIVSRTFSKIHGMAGLRVGYAIGHPDTLSAMQQQLARNGLSSASAAAALASLGDEKHLAQQRTLNHEARAFTREAYERAGYRVLPSEANFLMVDVRRDAGSFQHLCREAGLAVARPFPPLTTHARITIGTMDEMRRAMRIMLPILSAPSSARYGRSVGAVEWQGEC